MAFFGDSKHTGLGTNGFEVSLNYITGIPDPNHLLCSNTLKLAFKSLLKRDASTKEKSISTLLDYITENPNELDDDLVIITWVQLYPKLAIDDSKKVRSTSHQVQSQFVHNLGKKYAKYLRDTIGVWLAGLFDTDRSASKICRESINFSFGNNQEKISNIWKVFALQIFHYSHQMIAFETKDTISDERFSSRDESEAKYVRVLQAAILLMVHALHDLNSQEISDDLVSLLSDIFSQEALFECFSSRDFGLKKAAYLSFKTLVTSKYATTILNKSMYKSLSKAMVKGIKFDSKTKPLLYSGILVTILDTIVCVTMYDASFWINIKKSDDRLLSLIKLGSLNSEPIYYDVIFKLLTSLPDEFLSVRQIEKFEPFYLALIESVGNEKSIQFIEKGWKVVIQLMTILMEYDGNTNAIIDALTINIVKLLDSPRILSTSISALMQEFHKFANDEKDLLLDINAVIMDALPDKFIIFPDFKNYQVKHMHTFVESFINLLIVNKSDLGEVLLANSIDALEEIQGSNSSPELSFTIINVYIKKNKEEFSTSINTFLESMPKYITESFVDLPLETMRLYSHSVFASEKSVATLVNAVFIQLKNIDCVQKLLKVISSLKNFNVHDTTDLGQFLLKNSKSLSPDTEASSGFIYEFLTPEILANLFANETFHNFISNSVKHYNNDIFLEFAITSETFLERLMSAILDDNQNVTSDSLCAVSLLDELEKNILVNEAFTQVYISSVSNTVGKFDGNLNLLESRFSEELKALFLNKVSPPAIGNFKVQKLLSISNPLDLGLFYFIDDYESKDKINYEDAKLIINKSVFYFDLINTLPSFTESDIDIIIDLSLISEFSSDILFLESTFSSQYQDKITDFKTGMDALLLKVFKTVSFEDAMHGLISGDTDCYILKKLISLLSDETKLKSYYSHRIVKNILVEKIEGVDTKSFEIIDLKPLHNRPALLFVILEISKRFLTLKNFENLRTNTVANLTNVRRSTDIFSVGLENLVLLNSFIDVDLDLELPENFTMIAPHRCMILLNTLSEWTESEVAYDENFKVIRMVLSQFVQRYINSIYYVCDSNYPSDFIIKVFELGLKLVVENINLLDSEEDISTDLLYHSLRLFLTLIKYKQEIESWDDEYSDVESEIIDLFFKFSKIAEIAQPINIVCVQFNRVFRQSVKDSTLSRYYDRLYTLINSENVDVQRLGALLLHRTIPEIQDALVIDFTLSKRKANEDGISGIHLPQVLIHNINDPLVDYIEYEAKSRVYRYLWSWYLIMDHFKNITQQMRQDYITDIGDEKIGEFLNFIFTELDVNKFKIHEDNAMYVKNYSFDDNLTLNYVEETDKLLVNLIFDIMNNIGGTFAQNWFQSIKNKQLKQNIEKFIAGFISPQLINDILSTLSNKTSIEDSEFKININRKINEIKCLYNIDEQKMEISIVLPPNYPLAQISVNGISRVGVDEKKWKSWIMSAQYVINFQNGSILDSIKHFKDNVTANFENFEDCAICYSILNAVDHSTPNKVCPTCKHNFHSACLYRWFKSSGASTCPLCRSKFQFKKHA